MRAFPGESKFPDQVRNANLKRGGKPVGARRLLTEKTIKDLLASWQELGPQVIRKVAQEDPSTFLRCIVSLIPKDVTLHTESNVIVVDFTGTVAELTPTDADRALAGTKLVYDDDPE